ncbi:hemolysin activation/secretion protein [Azospirillum fermentarium]|uniref:ShlB/FhaC/HecB family hemolysin secretion/activation protein n=1 Tax=Azospirillum fermentarium TaxID=1233114 RepID=UPI002227FAE5|nr:ShlB/FhaC/HecB family hemolysin secretion/activation protein [Azospirillum fermentarium]MCW2247746.1 hemolysin activation/secretion protein [Azospirillum fermentarium]
MISRPVLKRLGHAGLALVCWSGAASAQDFERIAPKEPPANPRAGALPAPPPEKPGLPGGRAAILPALKGLVFHARADQLQRHGVTVSGVDTAEVDVLDTPEFHALIAPYLGQPVTLDRLNEIIRATVIFFREHDRPLVDVLVPEHDISTGTVQILALEFRAGQVRTEGNEWFSDELLLSQVRTASGSRISGRGLLEDVNWLNQNPFRRTDLVYQRSEQAGASDIILRTTDRFPVRVFGGYENTGTQSTDRNRTFAGFNWGNALWLDHQMSYQFTASPDFWRDGLGAKPHFAGHSGSYTIPLPWRHTLTLFGSYAESVPDLPQSFRQIGRSSQASARYTVPLSEIWGITHQLQAGFDWKRTNNNLEFGGVSVLNNAADVAQWTAAYSASRPDAWGTTALNAGVFFSPGGFNDKNTSAALQTQRAGVEARYAYARIGVDRLTPLPEAFSWLVRVQGQLASGPLMPSEQLGFGGNGSVRGFEERQINADQGVLFSTELRTPDISLTKLLGARDRDDKLQFLGFWDYGLAQNRAPGTGEPKTASLSGVGVGLRYTLAPALTVAFDYGWQVVGKQGFTTGQGRPHIALTLAY